jgi:hypothetical protein
MDEFDLANGQRVYYEYDSVQDMLYVLLRQNVGPTYYADVPDQAGVMLRYDSATDEIVGITAHNVQRKLVQKLITDWGARVLSGAV